MTATPDLICKWLERRPAAAAQLELRVHGDALNEAPLAVWALDQVKHDAQSVCNDLTAIAQDHCDTEAEPTVYVMTFVTSKGAAVVSRKLRRNPAGVIGEPKAKDPSADITRELLKTIVDQNRLIVGSVGALVAAHRETLASVTQTLAQHPPSQSDLAAITAAMTQNSSDPELTAVRVEALKAFMERGPAMLDLLIGWGTDVLIRRAGPAGSAALDAVNGSTTQQ